MTLITTLLTATPDKNAETVASDMEGTLSEGVTWEGLRDYLKENGRKREFNRFIRPFYIRFPLYVLGLINKQAFREELMIGLIRLYKGFTEEEFDRVADYIVNERLWPQRRQAVLDELHAHRDAGRQVVICSGLLEPMLQRFAAKAGLQAIGTPLIFENGHFTGEVKLPFTTNEQKVAQMRYFLPENGRLYAAYGDTIADVPLLSLSERPCAVSPDKSLRKHAETHQWRVLEG